MGITIERSNSSELSEYDSYRDTLHKARIYDNTRTFMTDVADWLTKIYKKSSK